MIGIVISIWPALEPWLLGVAQTFVNIERTRS